MNPNVLKGTYQEKRDFARSMATAFKKWPKPVVESKGNYEEEVYLEKLIGGPLYSHQNDLPRLPIPSISNTLSKLLPTALPLGQSKREIAEFQKNCDDFPSQVATLQQLLEERRKSRGDSSWLQHWWNTLTYLEYRDTVVINVSYFFHFSDDSTVSVAKSQGFSSSPGIRRAGAALSGVAEFRNKVCSGTLEPEVVGRKATKMCSTMYKYMFHACRIPKSGADTYRIYDPSLYNHCIVVYKGQFFSIDFIDSSTGEALPLFLLEKRLERCVELANYNIEKNQTPPLLGWLTGVNRDEWARSRQNLLDLGNSKINDALETLESGAVLICLDDEEPVSRKQCGSLFLHGNVSSSYNRWFDKSIQLIFTKNGKMGLCGEHSLMDGMPVVNFADAISKVQYNDVKNSALLQTYTDDEISTGVRDLFGESFDVLNNSQVTLKAVENAKVELTSLVEDHELTSLAFHGYGANYIKSCGVSPDAYIQMAMQLATYRLFEEQGGTYEATNVRSFLHGRTETTRTVSPASSAFCKEMGLTPKPTEEMIDTEKRKAKLKLFKEAVQSHVSYVKDAVNAQGIDRHLLGLSLVDSNGKLKKPDLYANPLYNRAKTWRVSTSHLTHPRFMNWGYGEVVPNGVGLSYMVKPDSFVFNMTALKENNYVERLHYLLEEALIEIKTLHDLDKGVNSKL